MKFDRRAFLGLFGLTGGLVAALAGTSWLQTPTQSKDNTRASTEHDTLTALVDSMVPADDTPGALDVGIHNTLIKNAAADPVWQARLDKLANQANEKANSYFQTQFTQLSKANRETVLSMLFSHTHIKDQKVLLENLYFKQEVLSLYYNSDTGQQVIGYMPLYQYPSYQNSN